MKTRGGVVIEEMKIGDILYESEMGMEIQFEVISKPVIENDGERDTATWNGKVIPEGKIVEYVVTDGYQHYCSYITKEPRFKTT